MEIPDGHVSSARPLMNSLGLRKQTRVSNTSTKTKLNPVGKIYFESWSDF